MKTILFLLFIVPMFCVGQVFPIKNGKIVYEYVFDKDSLSKESLYNASVKFFVDAFNNSNYVIKSQDKDAGQVIGKGAMDVSVFKTGSIIGKRYPFKFTLKTDVKEGKARIMIYDIYAEYTDVRYGVIKTETLEDLIAGQSKGINDNEKKMAKYLEWANLISDNFISLAVKFNRSLDEAENQDDW